jgi:hypothetical protein
MLILVGAVSSHQIVVVTGGNCLREEGKQVGG